MAELQPIIGSKHLATTRHTCPKCDATLNLYSLHEMKFEGCPKCHGIWLAEDELRQLKNKFDLGQLHWLNAEVDEIGKTAATASSFSCPKGDGSQLLSVRFGKSSVVIDWCPKCHGLWLDHDEFYKVIDYLAHELGDASVKDVEKEIARDWKNLWSGKGPESPVAEIADIAAAITAMLNFSIFKHPTLTKVLLDVEAGGRGIGMD